MVGRDLSPRDARDRFIARRRSQNTDNTVRSYANRLDRFVEFCNDREIEMMSEIDGWILDEYRADREEAEVAPMTLKGHLMAVKQLLKYLASIDVVGPDLHEKVNLPDVSKDDETSDDLLEEHHAKTLLSYYRDSVAWFGTPRHTTLEVLWHVGPRISGVRALDLQDFNPDERVLHFRHRPPTRLKDGSDHERDVLISEPVVDALEHYIARDRPEVHDDHGRKPLFSTNQGRASEATIRAWSYLATQPCVEVSCPHGNRRETCEYTERTHASKCPSSRSPHAIRTGSITWQLNNGLSYVKVATRVAASPETIRRYYDKPDHEDELERRRPITENMDIQSDSEQ